MSASAAAPDGIIAGALAGFERLEIVVKDRGLKGVKAVTNCNATYSGTELGTGGMKVITGEIIAGDTVCEYKWLSPVVSSGTVSNMSPSEETDGTDRKYATIYVDIGLTATSHRFNDYDAGSGTANGTVDLFILSQY